MYLDTSLGRDDDINDTNLLEVVRAVWFQCSDDTTTLVKKLKEIILEMNVNLLDDAVEIATKMMMKQSIEILSKLFMHLEKINIIYFNSGTFISGIVARIILCVLGKIRKGHKKVQKSVRNTVLQRFSRLATKIAQVLAVIDPCTEQLPIAKLLSNAVFWSIAKQADRLSLELNQHCHASTMTYLVYVDQALSSTLPKWICLDVNTHLHPFLTAICQESPSFSSFTHEFTTK